MISEYTPRSEVVVIMSYVAANGQVERGPGCMGADERPKKRAKTSNNTEPTPDAHAKPPDWIKSIYKRYQKMDKYEAAARVDLVDCDVTSKSFTKYLVKDCRGPVPPELQDLQKTFADVGGTAEVDGSEWKPPTVYQVNDIPGKSCYLRR